MLSFTFTNKDSFTDFGIYVTKMPIIPSPKRRVTTTQIFGRNGTLKYDEGTYDDITISLECGFVGNVFSRLNDIKAWLFESGSSPLVFSFENDKKYIAQVVNNIDFEIAMRKLGQFVVIFNCEPFKYAVSEPKVSITNSGTALINNGTIACQPIIEVYGSGDITLAIGSQQMQLKGISNKIILNSVLQDAYDDNLTNLNLKVTGEYFVLPVGSNNVSWTGSVNKVDITQNRRWL
ncbi:MAG: distal tail protein Dit [Thermodesulforhabdaceae bacterium]